MIPITFNPILCNISIRQLDLPDSSFNLDTVQVKFTLDHIFGQQHFSTVWFELGDAPLRSKGKIKEGISSSEANGSEKKKGLQTIMEQKDKLSLLGSRYHHQVHLELSLMIK